MHHLHNLLHKALDDAVKWGLIARNVCDAVDAPRRARREMKVWTPNQVRRVLAAAEGDDLEALWHLALTTGMRRGELLGLKWNDLDLEHGTLAVRRTLSRGSTSRLEEFEPKTRAGRRRIALSPSAVEHLKRHRVRQLEHRLRLGEVYSEHGYVFANPLGASLHPNTVYRALNALIIRAEVPKIPFHNMRHTAATLLMAEGIHAKIVQERLGHTDIAMTLNLYSHVTPDMQRQAADAVEAALARAEEQIA